MKKTCVGFKKIFNLSLEGMMTLNELIEALKSYDGYTRQSILMGVPLKCSNEYISVACIDTSNITGGEAVKGGKQWSIIMDIKKPFCNLKNWNL